MPNLICEIERKKDRELNTMFEATVFDENSGDVVKDDFVEYSREAVIRAVRKEFPDVQIKGGEED